MKKRFYRTAALAFVLAALALLVFATDYRDSEASSHREAPQIMTDPTADLTDVYAFVSPEDTTTVTLIMNVIPFEEPSGGPNFYRFDDNVRYVLNIDNDGDAVEDLRYVLRSETGIQNGDTFLYNTGPIGSLSDADYNFRQRYTITREVTLTSPSGNARSTEVASTTNLGGGSVLAPPERVGPNSTPNYESLADMGVYDLNGGGQVFAGQRDDPFFFDLGSIFDLLSIRPGPPGNTGGGVDGFGGFNIHTIALQVPIDDLTADGEPVTSPEDEDAVIGVWATTSRPSTTIVNDDGTRDPASNNFVQVSRLGQPAINEVIIPLGEKDLFNASEPADDAQFLDEVQDPELAQLLAQIYGIDVPEAPRTDLVNALLLGIDGLNRPMNAGPDGPVPSEQLRLNMGIAPNTPDDSTFSRLGVLGGDLSGFPNGRRVYDDVIDEELRVMAGVLVDGFNVSPNNELGDGVPANDRQFNETFPYLATPWSGFEHEHHPVGEDLPPGGNAMTFQIEVENVSTPGLLDTDRANGTVPLSPGAYVEFTGDDDPAFTVGGEADSGTRLIAEDGFPSPNFSPAPVSGSTETTLLEGLENVMEVGAFASPGGMPDVPAITAGETATFTITASPGARLQIETMFVQSDDWFLSFGDGGLDLFNGQDPVSGDVTGELVLYDAGTEIDAAPGTGPTNPPGAVQKPVQDPMATDVGTDESVSIQSARQRHDFDIPANSEVIQVTVTPMSVPLSPNSNTASLRR